MKTLVALMLALGLTASGHHSFATEYDDQQPVKVTGTISKVEWKNPHIWFYVDVKDASGKVTTWGFSGGPPGMLLRRGITKDVLKLGGVVTGSGFRARDGSNNGSGGKVTFESFPGQPHAFIPGNPTSPDSQRGLSLMKDFVHRCTGV